VSVRADALLWAKRILAKKAPTACALLELPVDAGLVEAQAAFHKIARTAHPDLHRSTATAEELETLTAAYARVAGAYQEFRSQRMHGGKIKMRETAPKTPAGQQPPLAKPAAEVGLAATMSPKALVYYRKAELALRRGDLTGAVLQLKLAIAADPLSQFLRAALAEVESEVGKTT
jgi:hypothetical protein